MKTSSLYLNHGKLIHPKVVRILGRQHSPCSPMINARDSFQPSHGIITRLH